MGSEPVRLGARDLGIVAFVALAWGAAFTAGRLAVLEISPYSVAALRYVIGAALLLAALHARENLPASIAKLDREAFKRLVLLALFSVVGYNVFLLAGLRLSTAINASLLAALCPLLTAMLASIVLGDPMRQRQTLGMVLSFAGLVVLVSRGSLQTLLALELNLGDLLLLAAMLCFAAQSIAAKRAMAMVSPLATTAFSCAIGACLLLPMLGYDLVAGRWGDPGLVEWGSVLFLGTGATVLAYFGWFYLVRRHGAGPMSPFLNLVPVCGAAIGVIAGEHLRIAHIVAGVLVLVGVMIATWPKQA